jgi:hypothetical protein
MNNKKDENNISEIKAKFFPSRNENCSEVEAPQKYKHPYFT